MPTLPLADLFGWWSALPPRAGRTRVLALDGRSGAGKTRLAAALADLTADLTVVHLDDAYPGWDGLGAVSARIATQLLRPLAAGLPAGYRRWDWAANRDGDWRPVPASPLLLLEGIGSGALACAPLVAGLVWLEAPEPLRRSRALTRDGARYGPHWQRWADQEQRYLRREEPRRRADLVLDGGDRDNGDHGDGDQVAAIGPGVLADRRNPAAPAG